jgi:hypothetical protein
VLLEASAAWSTATTPEPINANAATIVKTAVVFFMSIKDMIKDSFFWGLYGYSIKIPKISAKILIMIINQKIFCF